MSETGNLTVQVYTGRRALPIAAACVSVLGRNEDGSRTLKAFRRTGLNGYTSTMKFETPDESASTDAASEEKSFTSLDVMADSPGFYSVYVEGVQIFPNQDSLQEIEMIPLPEITQALGEGGAFSFDIPPQDL